MKKVIFIGTGLLLVAAITWLKLSKAPQSTNHTIIGILQTASHPALDQAREGFMNQLKIELNNEVDFIIHNFEGNIATGMLMAQALQKTPNISGIFAIATPSAQLVVSLEKQKPIFIAAVTNPQILADEEKLPDNLFGSTDMISIEEQVTTIKTLLPQISTIAIIFNQGEANSNFLHEKMKQTFADAGFTTKSIGITSEAELGNQVKFACNHADLIIAPTDNLVATTAGFIANMCRDAKIPFIVSDPLLVNQGPLLASGGIDYKKSGAAAGSLAAKVLTKQPIKSVFVNALQTKTIVNKQTMEALGLTLPLEKIELVQ